MNNVIAYSLQIAALVSCAAFFPWLLRMKMPSGRLAFWRMLLLACLVLPLVRPWRVTAVHDLVTITSRITTTVAVGHGFAVNGWTVLAAGALLRLAFLGTGLMRLRLYRRRAQPLEGDSVLLSDEILVPVTFGFRKPVILLPARFPEFAPSIRKAILCHERLHVERRDWLFTVAEELVRAAFWFHPAIWWLLGEIQLAREQVVDQAVIESTRLPEQYVDALLAIAGAAAQPDLIPAPMFLRRSHLKQRVVSILKRRQMSKARTVCALISGLAMVAAGSWFVTGAIPLTVASANEGRHLRIRSDLVQRLPISESRPVYPPAARAAGIQGLVRLRVEIGSDGKVRSAYPMHGPAELAKSAVDAVKQWTYQPFLLNGEPVAVIATVNVDYKLNR